uniref:Uncharacterized protein n=1 Tax=Candidatus Kentrum sp. MB TaxID=2138164 RepID=A0A450XVN0_9GAMM|nr:MAG: hypothetical protein BECKMB1821G_GA0114241_104114 [Candidatus Kentron sp. MB]VFK33297.1 MAG: hypothetical protein BECKMB1821I_GA0114274_104316 [Candidatus Kentron sp. MB]VFK76088.1 MAG: hypothetical protein BECKMB1821H_GA0114242_104116 [Candidatus Kentron sp. MB]
MSIGLGYTGKIDSKWDGDEETVFFADKCTLVLLSPFYGTVISRFISGCQNVIFIISASVWMRRKGFVGYF